MIKRWTVKDTQFEITPPELCELHNPFLMKDMDKATELIKQMLTDGKKITVYGDYDCDGITATVMLYSYLTALGAEADWYIPSREEGYGLNAAAIEKLANNGTELIITVDNGVSAFAEAELIKQKGISLVITDHHTVPSELPTANAIVNPKQADCKYPFKELAGCGVVLKLIAALENADSLYAIEQYGDLAAIGTIADIVPLTDENRHIVTLGLQNIEYSENVGLHCLIKKTGLFDKLSQGYGLDSTSMAFVLCPRINAAGRFAHPGKAVELLLCENHELAMAKAEELNSLNAQRIEEERRIITEIESYLQSEPAILNERVLVLIGRNWHHGIIGIIASRMVTRFGKPCAIITCSENQDEDAKGSFRSFNGFSVHAALTHCEELLAKFGGHSGAGGFSVEQKHICGFKKKLLEYAASFEVMPSAEITAESCDVHSFINIENVERLEELQPFGEGNPVPVFHLQNCRIKYKRPLKEGKYVSFNIDCNGREFKILDFSRCYSDFWYKVGDTVDLMINLSVNEYNGSKDVSMRVVDIRLAGITAVQDRFFAARDVYEKLTRKEEIDKNLYPRIAPTDEALKKVFTLIKAAFCLNEVVQRGLQAGINYCMLRAAVDVFAEVGLVELNRAANEIKVNETGEKVDLEKSIVLKELREKL